jgi:hypothetical protein
MIRRAVVLYLTTAAYTMFFLRMQPWRLGDPMKFTFSMRTPWAYLTRMLYLGLKLKQSQLVHISSTGMPIQLLTAAESRLTQGLELDTHLRTILLMAFTCCMS